MATATSYGAHVPTLALSVVIPAHNEEAVLGHCLGSVLAQDHVAPVQVIVIANGCRDRTADVARSYQERFAARGMTLSVLEIAPGSKPQALNAGDSEAVYDDRVYLDADVEISPGALRDVAAAFDDGVGFCAPQMKVVALSFVSRAYSRIWSQLPYVRHEVIGAGFYAISAAGRRRWQAFPEIGADDKFARLHFAPAERRVLANSRFRVFMPVGFWELVVVRARWIRMNREIHRVFPALVAGDRRRWEGVPQYVLRHPACWRDLPVVIAVYLCAEIRAWATAGSAREMRWERAVGIRTARQER